MDILVVRRPRIVPTAKNLFPNQVVSFAERVGMPQSELTVNVRSYRASRTCSSRGVSLVEIVVGMAIAMIIVGMAVPVIASMLRDYRVMGDARNLADQISLARLRASESFTRVRVNVNLTAKTYKREIYNQGAATWGPDTGSQDQGATQYLTTGNLFGYGSIASPPTGTQATIGQPPADGPPIAGAPVGASNQNVIVFNSRGIPIDSTVGGNPKTDYVIYLSDGYSGFCAVSINVTGKVKRWRYGSTWSEF